MKVEFRSIADLKKKIQRNGTHFKREKLEGKGGGLKNNFRIGIL